jgi:hypothetical protein
MSLIQFAHHNEQARYEFNASTIGYQVPSKKSGFRGYF